MENGDVTKNKDYQLLKEKGKGANEQDRLMVLKGTKEAKNELPESRPSNKIGGAISTTN